MTAILERRHFKIQLSVVVYFKTLLLSIIVHKKEQLFVYILVK